MAQSSMDSLDGLERVETAHMATTTVKVDGMTCGACTSAVESGFKGVNGAGAVSVSLVMGRAVVNHDPTKLSAEKVAEIIEDRGFDAEVLSTNMPNANVTPLGPSTAIPITTTTLSVEGMTCGACTSAVEGGFKDVAGIKSMSISLLSERCVVEHDASIISPDQVAEIIEDRGFGATIIESKTAASQGNSGFAVQETQVNDLAATTVSIEGMTCGACTSSVEGAFKDMEGLVRFNISLLAERAVITHVPSILSPEKIVETIEDAGFDAKIISTIAEGVQHHSSASSAQLKIFGLSDGNAATALETTLRDINGVSGAVISLSTSRATITYNSALTGLRAIVEAVESTGYNALVAEADDNNAQLESLAKTKEIQEWKRAFIFSLSFAVPVFCTSMLIPMFLPFMNFGAWRIIPGLFLGDVVCGILTIPVQFGIGKRFYISAYKSLKHKSPTMDVLVVLGTSAAFFFSCFAILIAILISPHNKPGTVFDTSTMLITFITLGRWLENRAKGQTSKALSRLMSLAPSMATIYEDPLYAEKLAASWSAPSSPILEKGEEKFMDSPNKSATHGLSAVQKVIPTELIEIGDIVILRAGDKIPADGTVTRGESYVNESMVTGEAVDILKKRGSALMAGTVNGEGRVDFRVTRAGKDTKLSQIVNLVQEAQTSRADIQRVADRIAGIFVPIIILLGLITFVGWMILSHALPHPPEVFLREQSGGRFMVCLKLCISVIVFACPCALGLATPTAVMVGTGVASEQGILVKGGEVLEVATKITHMVLDKTGTLTVGKLSVSEANIESTWSSNDWRRELWWTLVGLAEMNSEHPIGRSILSAAKTELRLGPDDAIDGAVGDFKITVGQGVFANIEPSSTSGECTRYEVLIGNARYLRNHNIALPGIEKGSPQRKSAGLTMIHVAIGGSYAGHLSLLDTIKPSAPAMITALHSMGITTSLVTGDTYDTAINVARLVGIPETAVTASVSPEEKQRIVEDLKLAGETVAMVGDGINDSPALSTAHVGIGLVNGSDIAVEAASIVIMRSEDMLNIPTSIALCRSVFSRIKMNLWWACGYNVIGLPFAMGLALPWGISVHPMAAGLSMAASSVSVTLSSLSLRYWKRPKWLRQELLDGEFGNVRVPVPGEKARQQRRGGILQRVMMGVSSRGRKGKDVAGRGAYVPLQEVEA
jgi:P-type Cu+ transporter